MLDPRLGVRNARRQRPVRGTSRRETAAL